LIVFIGFTASALDTGIKPAGLNKPNKPTKAEINANAGTLNMITTSLSLSMTRPIFSWLPVERHEEKR
jgi:hypothetical protein